MLRKDQSTDDVIISFPVIAVDGQAADAISSLAANIIQPDGNPLSNFTVASFTQPNSDGTHVANFGTGAASKAFTIQNTANPYVVTFTDPTSGIEPTVRELWITDRYPWELSKEVEVDSVFSQVQSTFDLLGTHNTTLINGVTSISNAVNSVDIRVQSHDAALTTHDTALTNHDTSLGNGITSLSNRVSSMAVEVDSTFSQVQSIFTHVSSVLVDDVWDEVLTGATHNVTNSAGRRLRQIQENLGYEGGAVWIDTVNGTAGTENFENGTVENPVDNIADANTLAASLGLSIFRVIPGSSITLAAAQNNQLFIGNNWTLALGGQDIAGSEFDGATVSGVAAGTGTIQIFNRCLFNATSLIKDTHVFESAIMNTITIAEAGDYFFDRCHSAIAGTSTPSFDFGSGLNASNLSLRNYSGGIEVQNMGAGTGSYNMSLEGRGQLIINANCSATSTIAIRGLFTVTDNAGGAVTLSDDARFDIAQTFTQVTSHDANLENGVTSISNAVASMAVEVSSLNIELDDVALSSEVGSVFSQVQSTFTRLGTHDTTLINGVTSISNEVGSNAVAISSISVGAGASQASVNSVFAQVQSNFTVGTSIDSEVGSNATALSSLDSIMQGLSTTTTLELSEEPVGTIRMEAGDTFQFKKNVLTDPQSVAVSIEAPDGTIIVSLAVGVQSGSSTNFHYFYDDQNSWHSTVESSGIFILEWTIFRTTGNDHEKQYFEVIKTD